MTTTDGSTDGSTHGSADGTARLGTARLAADGVTLGYDRRTVAAELTLVVPDGSFTAIVGPNASGKSTLLAALARVLRPWSGRVLLDGQEIFRHPTKEVARRLGLLPQSATVPGGITAGDLVARGRYPHQGPLRQWSEADEHAVDEAMSLTDTHGVAERPVDELSGGQRQRVWLAMVLAQETSILLLDEPTTFLDIAHQIDVLELCERLHTDRGRTLVAVLHDLNQAARYATHVVALRAGGEIAAEGPPDRVITEELVTDVFGLSCRVVDDPETGTPMVVPRRGARRTVPDAKPARRA